MAARHPLPYGFAKAHNLLLEDTGEERVLWAALPADGDAAAASATFSALSELLRLHAVTRVEQADAAQLANRIASAYAGGESSAAAVVGEVESAVDLSRLLQDLPAVEDLLEAANDAPIIRMLNALLTQAAKDGASDIHIEPYERSSSVRFRVDGTLREVVQPNRALHAALISRLKIMAELDIAEKRLPQDGRISLRIGGRAIDVRVSTLPSAHGERAVLRLLDKSESKFTLEGLGMSGDVLTAFNRLVHQPHGIVLVTGPTGSGKTTTLYASLGRIDTAGTNILTVEDPVEYELPGIGQTQVNPKIDLTFAKALRAILRQDPDVIMIGEIRDHETASIAIQASLTGHLVLATLHTNDAPSAVTRLIDMGVEPYLLSSSLLGAQAQRLVRKLCPSSKRPDDAGRGHPVGCADCSQTGYKGRTGVYELMRVDEQVQALIHGRAPEQELIAAARRAGLKSMREDGELLGSFERLVHQPHGIVLVTGPTGSGKTTTLYASLGRVDTATTNVLTVEDPVEYELPGIGQTQVNPKIDLTFAKALRAILRQDPDVIMIGEIRDYETASIAIQASLTGHLVLATVHTNDAPSSVTRLIDMGVEPFLLSSSLLGVLAQRLVRRLCPHCKRRGDDVEDQPRWHPVGCEKCGMTGYKGRTGVYELMAVDDKVRSLIHSRAAESQVFVAAEAGGLRSMREDGERLIDEGITSPEEVMRVTRE